MNVASIDIGSNTVLMLIAEVSTEELKIRPLREEQRMPRISEGLSRESLISDQSFSRLMNVVEEFKDIIAEYNCEKIIISGTSAFRKAGNAKKIKSAIENELNSGMNILSGTEEAESAFLGTIDYGSPDQYRLVIDIGGGSTEITYGIGKTIIFGRSYDIGAVSLSEKYIDKNKTAESIMTAMNSEIKKTFQMLPSVQYAPSAVIALAGTPVTLACIYKGLKNYDEVKVEGVILSIQQIEEVVISISTYTSAELLRKYPEIVKGREDLILSGAYILLNICELLDLPEIIISTKGNRYGAILKSIMEDS